MAQPCECGALYRAKAWNGRCSVCWAQLDADAVPIQGTVRTDLASVLGVPVGTPVLAHAMCMLGRKSVRYTLELIGVPWPTVPEPDDYDPGQGQQIGPIWKLSGDTANWIAFWPARVRGQPGIVPLMLRAYRARVYPSVSDAWLEEVGTPQGRHDLSVRGLTPQNGPANFAAAWKGLEVLHQQRAESQSPRTGTGTWRDMEAFLRTVCPIVDQLEDGHINPTGANVRRHLPRKADDKPIDSGQFTRMHQDLGFPSWDDVLAACRFRREHAV